MKEEETDTEFHIQFMERKKQDYLLHDNGIKKVYYSNDLKVVLSLDNRENMVKVYDEDMRNIGRFAGRKEMHGGKIPLIVDFDYSEMTMRLGVIFADGTLESIHLSNFLNKSQSEFEAFSLNQLQFAMPFPMKKVYYLHMINKWLTIADN